MSPTYKYMTANKRQLHYADSPSLGWILTLFMALLPCIYLLYLEYSLFTVNFNYLMRLMGRLSALFGISLFSLTFLLNTRLKFLEDLFGGLDKMYKAHRIFGTVAFLSLLFHPLFLASTYISTSIVTAAMLFLPVNGTAINLGIFSLLAMELFLIFTFFSNAKYQNWKFVHRLLGAAFFLGIMHTLYTPSADMTNALIKTYIVLMILIGSVSYSYRTLLWNSLVKRYSYTIENVKPLDFSITELTLAPENRALSFTPGQFIFLSLVSGIANSEPHPFTISSSASNNRIMLSIKSLGDFTTDLKNLKAGTKVKLEGPYGRFCPSFCNGKNQVWIAGGIGITPFLSMARSMETCDLNVDMYYCVGNRKEAVFLDELNAISSKNRNLKIIPFFSSEQGRFNARYIFSAKIDELKNKEIFLCGPPGMMNSLKSQFLGMGLPNKSIHMEEFGL